MRCDAPDAEEDVTLGAILVSPNHPNKYGPSSTCFTTVKLGLNDKIVLYFLSFEIEPIDLLISEDCLDYLEISSVSSSNSQVVDRVCGKGTPGPLAIDANTVRLKFHSNTEKSYHGFKIKVEKGK